MADNPALNYARGATGDKGQMVMHLKAPSLLMDFGLPDCAAHGPNEKFALENFYGGIESLVCFFQKLGP